jgi:hypothetical protein
MSTTLEVSLAGYVSETEAARLLGYRSLPYFQRLRNRGEGPAYIRHGQRVVYKVEDLEQWLDRRRVDPEAS